MSSTLYAQVPLRDAFSYVRLLTVLPGDSNGPIECELHAVELTATIVYEALSYHWAGHAEAYIRVNGFRTQVRENLHHALRALRRAERTRVLWVDALCIDQKHDGENGEKSHQLHLMRHIYANAQRTVAWVGLEIPGEATRHLVDFIPQLSRSLKSLSGSQYHNLLLRHGFHRISAIDRAAYGFPDDEALGWHALADLANRSWMTRAWVIQEVAVAREVTIQCGPYCFDFDEVGNAFEWMRRLQQTHISKVKPGLSNIFSERNHFTQRRDRSLLTLVTSHRHSQVQLPHDRIYALCGLASDSGSDKLNIQFQYMQNVADVYIEFTRAVLSFYQNLDIFSTLAYDLTRYKGTDFPSWVTDWSIGPAAKWLYRSPDSLVPVSKHFAATKATKALLRFYDNSRKVQLQGFLLDSVIEVSDIMLHHVPCGSKAVELTKWKKFICRCKTGPTYWPTGQPMTDVFYEVLTWGNVRGHLSEPLQTYSAFDHDMRIVARDRRKDNPSMLRKLKRKLTTTESVAWENFSQSEMQLSTAFCLNMRMIRTERGYIGLVHGLTQIGDNIALMRGGNMPLVIRKAGDSWLMIGDGYVHGIMMGEAWDDSKREAFWFS